MSRHQSSPLNANAMLQALGSAETKAQIEKLRARFEEHRGILQQEDQQRIEDALKRQETLIEKMAASTPNQ